MCGLQRPRPIKHSTEQRLFQMPPKGKKQSQPPLFKACEDGDVDAVTAIVEANPGAIEQRNSDGWTPLICAAFCGELDALNYLLLKGADAAVSLTQHLETRVQVHFSCSVAGCLQRWGYCFALCLCPRAR